MRYNCQRKIMLQINQEKSDNQLNYKKMEKNLERPLSEGHIKNLIFRKMCSYNQQWIHSKDIHQSRLCCVFDARVLNAWIWIINEVRVLQTYTMLNTSIFKLERQREVKDLLLATSFNGLTVLPTWIWCQIG